MKRALTAALLVAVAALLLAAVAELPPHGSPDSPPYTHVSAYYLEHGPDEAGAENMVTNVILNYRGFDTQGEVTVIVTAMLAVLAVLLWTGQAEGDQPGPAPAATGSSLVVRFIVRVMAPFIAVFGIYVILHGHVTPGGGFQGGTMIGALVIALTLVLEDTRSAALLPRRPARLLQVAAPLTFFGVGVIGLVLWGEYLYYPRDPSSLWITELLLLVVEAGIGLGGAIVIATIFRVMGAQR
ncbi:hydrogen gas-evolving membrane-bound hydrogenase subunit E [Anaerosoma tenue]|uniref:hydrogen gas-evolving membrane-bound hydrogenase subunit E n=1 Tax=Anaerosoma tenue TaxID=2933588 RepID=UPI002260ECCB|nr:hydrogen gas-evolving membrane-bound hydrogenase subunit E [Anaerosoma tenue]MCK8115209.1 sodium:proton antiporter [Anaerosoma tenue]